MSRGPYKLPQSGPGHGAETIFLPQVCHLQMSFLQ
jgi:hypothetical protein